MTNFIDNLDKIIEAPNGIEKLKDYVLSLAIKGKLTEQDSGDESASKLVIRINKNDKGAKNNKVSIIQNDETPHEIPGNWVWVNIQGLFNVISTRGKQLKTHNYLKNGEYPVIGQGKEFITAYSDEEDKLIKINSPVVIFGDHTKVVKYIDFDFIPGADGTKILEVKSPVVPKYFYWVLRSYKLDSRGYARHYKLLCQQYFPLLPVEEQEKIVKKVEQLFNTISEIDVKKERRNKTRINLNISTLDKLTNSRTHREIKTNWNRIYQNFSELYSVPENVEKLRQAVLQLAVKGKLVEQDPNDEPASELLKKIKKEKQRLIAEGKIKKHKELPPIREEEKPFELPLNWEWVNIQRIYDVISTRGKQIKTHDYLKKGDYPVIGQGKDFITAYSNDKDKLIRINSPVIIFGDHTKVVKYIYFDFIPGADGTKVLDVRPQVIPKYFYWVLRSYKLDSRGYARHYKLLSQQYFPLPPVEEQKRIVEKIDKLLTVTENLISKQTVLSEIMDNFSSLITSSHQVFKV